MRWKREENIKQCVPPHYLYLGRPKAWRRRQNKQWDPTPKCVSFLT